MLYFLALLLPPLAVLATGRLGAFLLNCLLCLCFWVPGIIHAIVVVADYKAEKRNERLIRAMQGRPR